MRKILLILACCCTAMSAQAQDFRHEWTLRECLDWALEHNLTVKQGALNLEEQEIRLSSARNNRLPTISASASENLCFGRGLTADNTYTS
ncbi:MAG: TolC family protein, partial [Bacteroidales bacterium]|nr:TolC family protein [Bacteroidales bacterium]